MGKPGDAAGEGVAGAPPGDAPPGDAPRAAATLASAEGVAGAPPGDAPRRGLLASPAVRMGLSVGVATGLYGFSFGAVAVAAGLSVAQACLLSLAMFTGASQFAVAGVLGSGGTGLAAWAAASLLGLRNGVYGAQLRPLLGPLPGWLVAPMAHLTIDESMAVASAQDGPQERRRGFWSAGGAVFVLWNAFTAAGAVAGDALGDPQAWGLDGAAVAAFLGLLWPRLRAPGAAAPLLAGVLVTLATTPWLPPGLPILAAAGAAALVHTAQGRPARRGAA